ncbi:MAG: hypothetical protein QM736_03285 [Vicinamibacterales bacterium]
MNVAHSGLLKRNAALCLIDDFRRTLAATTTDADVRALADRARARALALQGADEDRPYFAKTICQLATSLRRAGWTRACVDLLEWTLDECTRDAFLFTELVMCQLAADRVDEAEAVLARAEAAGMVGEAMYAAFISSYGRARRWADAQRVFDRATRAGVSGHFTYTALIDAYVRIGDLARARSVFTEAASAGHLDTTAFSALMRGYIRAGCAGEIARLGRQADRAGLMTDVMRQQITRILHRAGRTRQANRLRRRAAASATGVASAGGPPV